MFGYITINKEELKIKDYNTYRACYCGLCRSLKCRHGIVAPLTLSYDMTFLALLLTGLYETSFVPGTYRCVAHGCKKQVTLRNKWIDYTADMTILLAYHNLMDDWIDGKKVTKLTTAKLLTPAYRKVVSKYPAQSQAVLTYMKKLSKSEAGKSSDLDLVAGYTGEMLGIVFSPEEDNWKDILYRTGFYIGKFIYLMDAFEDMSDDIKNNNYNPLLTPAKRNDFEAYIENTLVMMMADCSREFEKLPILQYVDILRNILYSGVWVKYELLKTKGKAANDSESL